MPRGKPGGAALSSEIGLWGNPYILGAEHSKSSWKGQFLGRGFSIRIKPGAPSAPRPLPNFLPSCVPERHPQPAFCHLTCPGWPPAHRRGCLPV